MFIDELPNELLVRVATFLPFRDSLNLMITNKVFNEVLQRSRKQLAKQSLTSFSVERTRSSIILQANRCRYNAPKKQWKIKLVENPRLTPVPEEERLSQLATFYNTRGLAGLKWDAANKFDVLKVPNVLETLREHLEFVFSTTEVGRFVVNSLNPADYDVIREVSVKTGSSFSCVDFTMTDPCVPIVKSICRSAAVDDVNLRLEQPISSSSAVFSGSSFHNVDSLTVISDDVSVKVNEILDCLKKADTVMLLCPNDFSSQHFIRIAEESKKSYPYMQEIYIGTSHRHSYLQLARDHYTIDVINEEPPSYVMIFGEGAQLRCMEDDDYVTFSSLEPEESYDEDEMDEEDEEFDDE